MSKSKILFQLTGSIACFKACQLISKLVQAGHEVQTVASPSALQFVGSATLEGLTGKPVLSDLWQNGRMMDHIALNRWADLIITAPATANYLNKVAAGIADDLLSTLFLAHDFKKPFLIAPAMNVSMYQHPTTQASIKKLQDMGLQILSTDSGALACGEHGEGRLQEPEHILSAIENALKFTKEPLVPKEKILITAGGTTEFIDDVRVLTNISTGRTGALLADYFAERGYAVTLLHAKNATQPKQKISRIEFTTFQDLENFLKQELNKHYDTIIHLAAVSDYSVTPFKGKMDSDQDEVTLTLKKNKKLVTEVKNWSVNKDIRVIAFKMTSTEDTIIQRAAIDKLFLHSKADFIVHNDTHEMKPNQHIFSIYKKGQKVSQINNAKELAKELEQVVQQNNNQESSI